MSNSRYHFPSGVHKWRNSPNWWVRHSLSIVLTVLLIVQSVVFHFTELPDWTAQQRAHGESAALWPGYWLHYAAEWFVSILADTYGALLLVVLTKWFYEVGSDESGNAPSD